MAPGRLSSSADSQRAPSDFDDTTIAASSSRSSKCPKCNSHRRPSWEDRSDQKYPPLDQPLHGWPELAKAIETYADFEAFPAFRDLNIKSLLYYQCELTALRKKLHEQEWEDHRSHFEDAPKFNSRVDFLLLSEPPPQPQYQGNVDDEDDEDDDETHEQMELINKIRIVLEKYNHALLQYSQINALPAADRFNVDSLHKWLTNSKLGDTVITGPGAETWGKLPRVPPPPEPLISQFLHLFMFWSKKKEEFRKDLVVPRSAEKVDGLTHWVANEFVPFWQNVRLAYQAWKKKSRAQESCLPNHDVPNAMVDKEGSIASVSTFKRRFSNLLGSKRPSETTSVEMSEDTLEVPPTLNTYSMNSMIRFTSRVATIIACLFPTVGIAVLAKIHDTGMVIGFIALFTFLFAAGLMALTNFGTSRTEIFTATAAFSAVLVVFVQNQTG